MRVDRAFAFLDLCGFTRFTETNGDEQAVEVLTRFRACIRSVASDFAVRVDKWLGDGVMLVSTTDAQLVESVLMLMQQVDEANTMLPLRAGAASGPVILLEGDDYIGSSVNLAARLCSTAGPRELLATERIADAAPSWATVVPVTALVVPGFIHPVDVTRIEPTPVELPEDTPTWA
jgi:adenylate cyclase